MVNQIGKPIIKFHRLWKKSIFVNIVLAGLFIVLLSCEKKIQMKLVVRNIFKEFNEAVAKAEPGMTITLANGVWKDAELVFEGKGTEENPIKLTVEDKGEGNFRRGIKPSNCWGPFNCGRACFQKRIYQPMP